MDRRKALQNVALLLGGTIVGSNLLLQGCKSGDTKAAANALFTADQLSMLDEIAETILPKTDTPGAKECGCGPLMATMVSDCYTPEQQKIFIAGIDTIDKASQQKFGSGFLKITPAQRTELLTAIDQEQKDYTGKKKPEEPAHYFRMMKELTIFGLFTSELGATKVARYVQVPGKYEGCIPYKKGDHVWAT